MDTPSHREEIAAALPVEAAPLIPYIAAIDDKAITAAVIECLKRAPEYFWRIPASSTGKYHPAYCLGEGGLVRHTAAACRIFLDIAQVYLYQWIDRYQIDKGLAALLLHDTQKNGPAGRYTVHEHPLLAAEKWYLVAAKYDIGERDIFVIGQAIECHMGQWTTSPRSKAVLPIPSCGLPQLVHLADYLASRKHITISTSID